MTAPWQLDFPSDNSTSRHRAREREPQDFMGSLADSVVKQARKKRLRPSDVLIRAAVSELMRPFSNGHGGVYLATAEQVAEKLYGNDGVTLPYLAKAAVNPAQTTTAGWAAELIQTSVADFLVAGEPASAFGELASKCLRIEEAGSVRIPVRTHPVTLGGSWIGEASPKPVYAVTLTSATITPYKLACISAWSNEIAEWSTPSIEAIVRDALRHDLLGLLDTTLLGTAAASAGVKPAGIFNAATAVTPTASGTAAEKLLADVKALWSAVVTNAPDARPVFVVNSAQALSMASVMQAAPDFGIEIVISNYMTAGSVGAIDANALAMMLGELRFQSSSDATVHTDTSPLAIGTVGSPNTVAAPTISLFQADCIGLRSTLVASWALRRTGATALATGVGW